MSVRGTKSSVIFREFSVSGPEKCVTLQSFSCTFIEPITNQFDLVTASNTHSITAYPPRTQQTTSDVSWGSSSVSLTCCRRDSITVTICSLVYGAKCNNSGLYSDLTFNLGSILSVRSRALAIPRVRKTNI